MKLLVIILVSVFGYVSINCEDKLTSPEWYHGWKFQKYDDGKCFIHRYRITPPAFGGKETPPLMNRFPMASHEIDCYEGHTVIGMNYVKLRGEYSLAVCFAIPGQKLRIVCSHSTSCCGFYTFVDKLVYNSSEIPMTNVTRQYFYMGPFYHDMAGDDYFAFCVRTEGAENCVQITQTISLTYEPEKKFSQFDAVKMKRFEEPSKENMKEHDVIFPFNGITIWQRGEDHYFFTAPSASILSSFGLRYNFINMDVENISKIEEKHSFFGIKLIGKDKLVVEDTRTKKLIKEYYVPIKIHEYDSVIGVAFNFFYDRNSSGLIGVLCVIDDDMNYSCYNVSKNFSSVVFRNFCRACETLSRNFTFMLVMANDVFDNSSNFTLIVQGMRDWLVFINTGNKQCGRVDYSALQGYDPIRNKSLPFDDHWTIDGIRNEQRRWYGLHGFGGYTYAKVGPKEWIVSAEGKITRMEDWDYDYVVEKYSLLSFSPHIFD